MLTDKQKERYNRQIISREIGEEGQEILRNTKVLQIGVGGLGSPFALYLTAAGIGELTIIDNDTVSLSNLNRQVLFDELDLGNDKVGIAKEKLGHLNSDVSIRAYKEYVDEDSIQKYVEDVDFIVDCSDNIETKFLVNRVAIQHNLKCVIAGIKDFYGQIITIDPEKSACYHCIFPHPDKKIEEQKARTGALPVIGVTPGILGTLEASEVIKTVLGMPNLENKLLMVNLRNLSFNIIEVKKSKDCICNQ